MNPFQGLNAESQFVIGQNSNLLSLSCCFVSRVDLVEVCRTIKKRHSEIKVIEVENGLILSKNIDSIRLEFGFQLFEEFLQMEIVAHFPQDLTTYEVGELKWLMREEWIRTYRSFASK